MAFPVFYWRTAIRFILDPLQKPEYVAGKKILLLFYYTHDVLPYSDGAKTCFR
jgi:hypothetical protein